MTTLGTTRRRPGTTLAADLPDAVADSLPRPGILIEVIKSPKLP